MESQNKVPHDSAAQGSGTGQLIDTISAELSHIAHEIERFPIADGHSYSSDEIAMLQGIDFCSQKLKEIASLLQVISDTAGHVAIDRKALDESVRIEAIRAKVL